MASTQRSLVWGFIALLFALAFLRSLSPARAGAAVKSLLDFTEDDHDLGGVNSSELRKVKAELARERVALQRWEERLQKRSKDLDEIQADAQPSNFGKHNDPLLHRHDPRYSTNRWTDEEPETATDIDDPGHIAQLPSPDECPIIIVPKSSSTVLGIQIQHIWNSLSITLAIRNACIAIPPVMSSPDEMKHFRPVPFHQVFDLRELSLAGIRFVPLRACIEDGIEAVFHDSDKESAVLNNFHSFIQQSHPHLEGATAMVRSDSKRYRLLNGEKSNRHATAIAQYIHSKLNDASRRQCIGVGSLQAPIATNPDVLSHFSPSKGISTYVDEKYPHLNRTLFVKLRWNSATCKETRTDERTVCIFPDKIVPVQTYVRAIAHAAEVVGAIGIYLSVPAHVPDDVNEYIAMHLAVMDPVLLDVEGDIFTARVIEREIAVRSVAFVPDGGAWDDGVQKSRQSRFPQTYNRAMNSIKMINNWRDAGSPTAIKLLLN